MVLDQPTRATTRNRATFPSASPSDNSYYTVDITDAFDE